MSYKSNLANALWAIKEVYLDDNYWFYGDKKITADNNQIVIIPTANSVKMFVMKEDKMEEVNPKSKEEIKEYILGLYLRTYVHHKDYSFLTENAFKAIK